MWFGFHPLMGTQGGVILSFKKAILVKWLKREKTLSITKNQFSKFNLFSITAFFFLKSFY